MTTVLNAKITAWILGVIYYVNAQINFTKRYNTLPPFPKKQNSTLQTHILVHEIIWTYQWKYTPKKSF